MTAYNPRVFRYALIAISLPCLLSCAFVILLEETWVATVDNTRRLQDEIDFSIELGWAGEDAIAYEAKVAEFISTGHEESKAAALRFRQLALKEAARLGAEKQASPLIEAEAREGSRLLLDSINSLPVPENAHPIKPAQLLQQLFASGDTWAADFAKTALIMPGKATCRDDRCVPV